MTTEGQQLYCLVQTDTFSSSLKVPLLEFADMDRDGMADMVFYDETQSAIFTLYNRKVANKASDDSLCSKAPEIKNLIGEGNRIFTSFANIEGGLDQGTYDINMTTGISTGALVSPALSMPGRIRVGDIDADGFPDIIITVNRENSLTESLILLNKGASDMAPQVLQLKKSLQNSSVNGEESSSMTTIAGPRRVYLAQTTGEYSLNQFGGNQTTLGAFVDIDEDGRLDIMLQGKDGQGKT